MPNLSQSFFAPLLGESGTTQNAELHTKLTIIYGDEPRTYQNLEQDFEVCKEQLIKLLDFIEKLNPQTLQLFATYKQKVSKLTNESAPPDITITLKASKDALEHSLFSIISKHAKVDKTAVNSLTVNLCYTGAYANIEHALGYFSGATSLAAMVQTVKHNRVLELAATFLNERNLVKYKGNEIHMANALFNYVAHIYGLRAQEDIFAPNFEIEILEQFQAFVDIHFNVPALLQQIVQLLPTLPEKITQQSEFQMLTDFFQILGQKNPGLEQYQLLYDDEDIDDVATYVRKEHWELLHTCVIASYLEQAGYISGAHRTIGDKKLIDTGEYILDASNDIFGILSDEHLLTLFKTPNTGIDPCRLIRQMKAESIFEVYKSIEPITAEQGAIKDFCFLQLLRYPELSIDTLNWLHFDLMVSQQDVGIEEKQRNFAYYVFTNLHPLTHNELLYFAGKLSAKEQNFYLYHAISKDSSAHVNVLLPTPIQNPSEIIKYAIRSNALNVITLLYRLNVYLNATDDMGYTPACHAVLSGNTEALIKLHEFGVNLYMPVSTSRINNTHPGKSPVHIAVTLGNMQMLEALHRLNIDFNVCDSAGYNAACIAVNNNNPDVLIKLHELGVDLNKKGADRHAIYPFYARINCFTPIQLAISNENIEMVNLLKNLGVDLDKPDENGDTPACIAVSGNKLSMLNILHESGADFSKSGKNGLTPACLAAMYGNIGALKKLKQIGVNINQKGSSGATPAFVAAAEGRADSIRTLKTLKADFNTPNDNLQTPTFIAAKNGHVKVLRWLHEYGANLNTPDDRGHTPAYTAALHGQVESLNALEQYGADLHQIHQHMSEVVGINAENNKKMFFKLINMNVNLENIPLSDLTHIINKLDDREVEEVLFSLIKNNNEIMFKKFFELLPNKQGFLFYLSLFAAQHARSHFILELLDEQGASLNSIQYQGENLSHIAAKFGNELVLSQLIALGISMENETDTGETPAFIAARTGQYSIIALLLKENAAEKPAIIDVWTLRNLVAKESQDIKARAEQQINERVAPGDSLLSLSPRDIAQIMGHDSIVSQIDTYRHSQLTTQNRFGFFSRQPEAAPSAEANYEIQDENTSPSASPSKVNAKKRPCTTLIPEENKKTYSPPVSDEVHRFQKP